MRSTPEYSFLRQPCPDRFLDEIGSGFAWGAICGSIFHFIKGVRNSPNGERIFGGAQAIRMNAPRSGGGLAAYCGLFAVCDCTMVYIRQKEDLWNSVAAGAGVFGIYDVRRGLWCASRSALLGAALCGLLDGGLMMLRKALDKVKKQEP